MFVNECIHKNLSVQLAADLVVSLCRYQLHNYSFRGDIPLWWRALPPCS